MPILDWAVRPIGSNAERAIYVLMFAVLIVVRMPRLVLEGRFWAEEGTVFFHNAWTLPWQDALLLSFAGYLNLIANLAGVLARYLAPVPLAPYVSTGFALLIQCIPAVLIVTSRLSWLQSRGVVLLALLIILTPPDAQEVWMSSIGSQFFLALAAAIVLAIEARSGAVGALQIVVLAIAPLSGPASWLLAPLFVARAAVERSWPRTLQAAVLVAGVAVELAFFYTAVPHRQIGIAPSLLGAVALTKHIINPFLSPFYTPLVFRNWSSAADLNRFFAEAGGPIWALLVVGALFAAALAAAIRYPRQSPLWFLLAGATSAAGYAGALGSKSWMLMTMSGGRYVFAAQVLFGLALLSWGVIHRGPARSYALAAVAVLLVVGLSDYFAPAQHRVQRGPPWPVEVAKWQHDPHYTMMIWPPGWTMTLPPK